jgi:hypothetical protein
LLLDEVDFFPVHTSTSQLSVDFMVALTGNVVRAIRTRLLTDTAKVAEAYTKN